MPLPKSFTFPLQPAPAWTAILGLILMTIVGIVGAGGLLRLAFPAGCFAVGVFLYLRYPLLYLGFAWWVWFLSPFVRRLVDWQSGWVDPSPILLAPFLVSIVTLITLIRHLPQALYRSGLPFVLCLLGVMYGFLVAIISYAPASVIVPLLNWLTPILFGFHLYAEWRHYPDLQKMTQRVFSWGVLVMGSYGVVQYLIAPEWDRVWLRNQSTLAFGTPEPLGIRVFSTMHSPQPFAAVMTAGLLLLLVDRGTLRFPASVAGYLAFLLSLARSAWLSWFVGIVTFLPSLKATLQMRLILSLLLMSIVVLPFTMISPFSEVISSRLESLTQVQSDASFAARSQGYTDILGEALLQLPGYGIGSVITNANLGSNDSGILTLFFSLGWLGTVPYLGGLLLLIVTVLTGAEARIDPFASAARAIAIGTFAQIGLNNVMLGIFGMVLWSFIGLSLAARQYHTYHKR